MEQGAQTIAEDTQGRPGVQASVETNEMEGQQHAVEEREARQDKAPEARWSPQDVRETIDRVTACMKMILEVVHKMA